MNKQYVEKREEGYWISFTLVSLDSVVFAFLDEIDEYLKNTDVEFENLRQKVRNVDPQFHERLSQAGRF